MIGSAKGGVIRKRVGLGSFTLSKRIFTSKFWIIIFYRQFTLPTKVFTDGGSFSLAEREKFTKS